MKLNQFGRLLLTNSFLFKMVQMRRCFQARCTKPVHEKNNIKKMCRYKQESGRSMIEMLGVLAIIGVLSIGAIAGYNKAMIKYKTNKIIGEINTIVQNCRTVFSTQKYSYMTCQNGSRTDCELLQKLGILPELIQTKDSVKTTNGITLFIIQNEILSFGMRSSSEMCVSILAADWKNSGLLTLSLFTGGGFITQEGLDIYPELEIDNKNIFMYPADITTIHDLCNKGGNNALLFFEFKI